VLENATELLRAQKQSAWKEVARRVAHEIKNPLTPISLSAEQIRRHIGRIADMLSANNLDSPSVSTIQRSSEVISGSVESMRSLVDQFSSLAEFPHARPRPADLNTIVDNSLAMFAGRLHGISVISDLSPSLPLVLADPEALKRALSNLVDNAAEAMNQSLLREIRIVTALSRTSEAMVELIVADTGPGVTDEMRERLFLPYFSTKQRGSGLGLTIAAKIVADHQGTIRVEKNQPSGARFVIELPIVSQATDVAPPASNAQSLDQTAQSTSHTDEVHA
jgi:two-component system, NtrC family, nitrogen regulation sensor histidine kinase NtrY